MLTMKSADRPDVYCHMSGYDSNTGKYQWTHHFNCGVSSHGQMLSHCPRADIHDRSVSRDLSPERAYAALPTPILVISEAQYSGCEHGDYPRIQL